MYHWETTDIIGEWAQINGDWHIMVDCGRYEIPDPTMLMGRCVTVKETRQRLGELSREYRHGCNFYKPWRIEDFNASPGLMDRLRRGYLLTGKERKRWEWELRMYFKSIAARARNTRPGPAYLCAWERWALEPLDGILCNIAANGLGELPANQLELASEVDLTPLLYAFRSFGKRERARI